MTGGLIDDQAPFYVASDGNVGVGATVPATKLDVRGNMYLGYGVAANGQRRQLRVYGYDAGAKFYGTIHSNWEDSKRTFDIYTNSATHQLKIDASANAGARILLLPGANTGVGIGTTDIDSYKLAVDGAIRSTEVKVEASPWPDYVFTPEYDLQSLSEIETYINQNGHLPNIPSAAEVEENNGIQLGEMNAKLLEKIEELTLYVIDLDKRDKEKDQLIKELKEELQTLKTNH
ncbi:MAG: hypothetical protein NXI20_18235 [bacterium]|nr:hypothetical protein [bacterium]